MIEKAKYNKFEKEFIKIIKIYILVLSLNKILSNLIIKLFFINSSSTYKKVRFIDNNLLILIKIK